jgi:hypothetical protein
MHQTQIQTKSNKLLITQINQFLELYGCRQSVSSLATLFVTVVGVLDVSPDGDDIMRSWHL